MFQTKLTQPDVGAASAITPGVVDQSGAIRARAEEQRAKDLTNFAMSAMQAGFEIDKHVQTSRLAEKQNEFVQDFAKFGLDALSDEDRNYIQEYTGQLTAVQKDQIKPHIYKAIVAKNYREAVASRPWLESELRQASNAATGLAAASVDLSLQSQAIREKEMIAAQQQKDAELKSFKDSFSKVFGDAYVQLAFANIDPNLDPQQQVNMFLSADPSRAIRLNNATERKALEDQAAIAQTANKMNEQQMAVSQSRLLVEIAQRDLLNIQTEGENLLVSNAGRFSPEGQELMRAVASGESIYNIIPSMSKTDQEVAIGVLKSGVEDLRAQVTDAFMKAGATSLPSIVSDKLAEGDRLITALEGALKGDTAAMRQLEQQVKMNELLLKQEVQEFGSLLKENEKAAYQMFLADSLLGSQGALANQQMSMAVQRLQRRQLDGESENTVAAGLGSSALAYLSDDVVKQLPEGQRAQALAERGQMYFEPFVQAGGFKYEDVVELSTNLTNLEDGLRKELLANTDPSIKASASRNLEQSAISRLNALRERIERNGFLELGDVNGVPIVVIKEGQDARGPAAMSPFSRNSVSMQRERNKVAQELNALMRHVMPSAMLLQGMDVNESVIHSFIKDSLGGGGESPFDQAAESRGVLGSVVDSVISPASAMSARPRSFLQVPEDEPGLTIEISGSTPEGINYGRLIAQDEGYRAGLSSLDGRGANSMNVPSERSGITIAGVDLAAFDGGSEKALDVLSNFLEPEVIESLREGADLRGQSARDFIRSNKIQINLSEQDIQSIASEAAKPYEQRVIRALGEDNFRNLDPKIVEPLVSLSFLNTGPRSLALLKTALETNSLEDWKKAENAYRNYWANPTPHNRKRSDRVANAIASHIETLNQ